MAVLPLLVATGQFCPNLHGKNKLIDIDVIVEMSMLFF